MARSMIVAIFKSRSTVLFLLYAVVAVVVVPHIGQDLPYSVFYSSTLQRDHDRLLADNAIRIEHAQSILNHSDCNGDCWRQSNEVNGEPEFCFVILSVRRPVQTKFLTQVVAGLLPQLPRERSVFTVYNAEGPTHQEAINLTFVVPVHSSKKKRGILSLHAQQLEDYIDALEWCHSKKARFSVILEDDGLPLHDFIQRLQLILDYRMSKTSRHWMFLKLYYPEKWQGWSNEREILAELILLSILGGMVLVFGVYSIEVLASLSPAASYCETIIRFLLSALLVGYTLFCIGRPHWIALRQFSPHLTSVVSAPGCCIPAVLFPKTHLNDVIQSLKATKCTVSYHIDSALDDIAAKKGLQGYLAIPNLVTHIGFVSSLGKGWKSPKEFQYIL